MRRSLQKTNRALGLCASSQALALRWSVKAVRVCCVALAARRTMVRALGSPSGVVVVVGGAGQVVPDLVAEVAVIGLSGGGHGFLSDKKCL